MKDHLDEMSPIGEIAAKFGVTLRALRFYEEKGLLNPVRIGAIRLYNKAAEQQLEKILEAKRLGYSISMMRKNIPLTKWDLSKAFDKDLLRDKLERLRREEREIKSTISKIEGILSRSD